MTLLKTLLVIALAAYLGLIAVMFLTQRALMYFPDRLRTAPDAAGFPEAEEIILETRDRERVIVWHVPPRGDAPVLLYFHGNGGALRGRVDRFRALIADGSGLVALSYRGYGGSSGTPTEAGLIDDGLAAYDFAVARYAKERIALWGESLGTGVAVAVAAVRPVGHVILEAPFSSAVDVAARVYPYVPARWLMKDQFRSDLRIADVTAPVLILHGDQDNVVPIDLGQGLYGLVRAPKQFVRIPGGGHEDLGMHGAVETAKAFIAGRPK
jgi:fermentation-respiration switch protein FrsA (DUF1100 family)